MSDDFKYIEYRESIVINKPTIIDVKDTPNSGFRSMYQINESGKEWVEKNGLKGFGKSNNPVWSEQLFVDFDGNKEDAVSFHKKLKEEKVSHEIYFSGSKGYHFHIDRNITPSVYAPYSDKKYVKNNVPGADTSIYTHLHPFRLVGTMHEKTHKPKELVESYEGKFDLSIDISIPEIENVSRVVTSESIFENELILALSFGFSEGSRNKNMCRLGRLLFERGFDYHFVLTWLEQANLMNNPPLMYEEILKIVDNIYIRV